MDPDRRLYGAIEAGGTRFTCAIARGPDAIVAERTIPTTVPSETMAHVIDFFNDMHHRHRQLTSLGVAAFGPLQLDRDSPDRGRLLATPKPGWSHFSFLDALQGLTGGCPVEIDTDVNAAALAESILGAGRGLRSVAYVTVGTGIGGGAVVAGSTLRGWLHPEMGHIFVQRHPRDPDFRGVCPFHTDCVEGLASGVAIRQRWHRDLASLPADHLAYAIVGNYLGQLAATIALVLSPERLVFGGGVMANAGLLPRIQKSMKSTLAGYLPARQPDGAIENSVHLSALGGRAGLYGAILLAMQAAGDGLDKGMRRRHGSSGRSRRNDVDGGPGGAAAGRMADNV